MRRASSALPIAGIVLAAVGLVLLILAVARTVGGTALGTLGMVLLWVGVGLVAISMLLFAFVLFGVTDQDEASYAADNPETPASAG